MARRTSRVTFPFLKVMNFMTQIFSWLFGLLLVGLSLFVSLETLARKVFNFSFQGADELGGYVLALGGALSFTVALIERGHIRIDLLHDHLPKKMQAILNCLSTILLGLMGAFFAWYCWLVIRDTIEYGSVAPTAWATPMIYPQSLWYACMLGFSAVSVWLAGKAIIALVRRDFDLLNREYQPRGAKEELDDELSDLKRREL